MILRSEQQSAACTALSNASNSLAPTCVLQVAETGASQLVQSGINVAWRHLNRATAGSVAEEGLSATAKEAAHNLLKLDKGLEQLPLILADKWPENIEGRPQTITVAKTGEVSADGSNNSLGSPQSA